MSIRVVHLSTYSTNGGAARAASALHRAMVRYGVNSRLVSASGGRFVAARLADRQLWRLQRSPTSTWRSPARFGYMTPADIDALRADVVNLHWVTDGFLSVETIGAIGTPRVWSMYDMWPFTGTEHYGVDTPSARWRVGYTADNRPPDESGIDLDRMTWTRKRDKWTSVPMVPASTWLESATRNSSLMRDWPITRIPHVVDEFLFSSISRSRTRSSWGLSADDIVITFLASAGVHDRRKGFDLLLAAMPEVVSAVGPVTILVVGPQGTVDAPNGVTIAWAGSLSLDVDLQRAYATADVVAVPSREDNMPLTAMEAQSCSRAVVAFAIGGLSDIVEHGSTGALAAEGDIQALACGLVAAIEDARGPDVWGRAAYDRARATWSEAVVVPRYLSVYEQVLAS